METSTTIVIDTPSSPTTTVQDKKIGKTIPLVECFGPTIQGEGFVAGQRTFFLRFGLCDYRCIMCDSMHAVDPYQVKAHARYLTQQEIFDELYPKLRDTNCGSVTFSGGNPCIHDLTELVRLLLEQGIMVTVETQGTFQPKWVFECDYVTVSPKSPGMGEKFERDRFQNFIHNLIMSGTDWCCKVVIFAAQDLEFASMVSDIIGYEYAGLRAPPKPLNPFYLSVGNDILPAMLYDSEVTDEQFRDNVRINTERILEEISAFPALKYARLLPQTHTLLWGNAKGR